MSTSNLNWDSHLLFGDSSNKIFYVIWLSSSTFINIGYELFSLVLLSNTLLLQCVFVFCWDLSCTDLVQTFLKDYTILAENGKNIILCWIPSHVGILGNEKADAAAKLALSLPVTRMKLPASGMYPRMTKLILDEWQEVWNCCAGNKLHAIRPTVGDYKQKTCLSRCDSVLLHRLHIGHTHWTHFFLLSGDDLPECGTCQCPLTVKHILVECVDLNYVWIKYFVASSIKDLFDNIEAHKIVDFIKETSFYKQLCLLFVFL